MTEKQRELLTYLRQQICLTGTAPTNREICEHFGWASPNAAHTAVMRLAKTGCIEVVPGGSRGIRLKFSEDDEMRNHVAVLRAYNAWRRDEDGVLVQPDPRRVGRAIERVCDFLEESLQGGTP